MTTLNPLDEKLVHRLGEDARQSSERLAKQLNVSPATVRRRLRKLIGSGVIRVVAVADPVKAGFPLTAVISFDIAHEKLETAVQKLAGYPAIKWVAATTGRFDVMAQAVFRSTEELSDFVQRELVNIEGLRDTETSICLQVKKGRYLSM